MIRRINRQARSTKVERAAVRKETIDYHQRGEGLHVYRNRSRTATLTLPKPAADGTKEVGPHDPSRPGSGEWIGDSYFMEMVKRREALYIREIKQTEKPMNEEKLILDQPTTVTQQGPVEHVVVKPQQALNETPNQPQPKSDTLLNEDPMSGITILTD